MSLISSVEHAYAVAISDAKKIGKVINGQVISALKAVHADAPTIEAVTALVSPQLANLERVGDAVLGTVIKAIEDGAAAGAAGGVNIQLDAALVADIKSIAPLVTQSANVSAVAAPVGK